MFLVDSHCHLEQLDYLTLHRNVADVVDKAKARDVCLILAICTTLTGLSKMTTIVSHCENVLFSCGIHPLNIDELYDCSRLYHLAASNNVVAIGETGLDYYYRQDNKKQQQKAFRDHIRVGIEQNKPVIIHMRSACRDTLTILREEKADKCGGVLHCFTEDRDAARVLLDLGFYISFSGIITFRNAEALRAVAQYVPLDHLLVETDSPYLTPVPHRGKENQPAYVRDIAEYLATLKGTTLERFTTITTNNFSRLFHVDINVSS